LGKKIAVLVLAILLTSSTVYAQTTEDSLSDTAEFGETFSELQNEFQEADARFANALQENDQATELRVETSFFDRENFGLWLSWILLAVVLFLLMRIRHTLIQSRTVTVESPGPAETLSVTDPLHATLEQKRVVPAEFDIPAQVLVKPVKTVKIKVRKISKKK